MRHANAILEIQKEEREKAKAKMLKEAKELGLNISFS